MKLSKSLYPGALVSKRGDKYVVCGKHMQPCGVYVAGQEITIIDATDTVHKIVTPEGVAVGGTVTILETGPIVVA